MHVPETPAPQFPVGFFRRTAAFLVDAIVVHALTLALFLLYYRPPLRLMYLIEEPSLISGFGLLFGLLGTLVAMAYFTVMTSLGGQTVGKAIVGARVVRFGDHGGVGFARALLRWLGYALSGLPLYYGFVCIGFRRDRRGLHDTLADTWVVSDVRGGFLGCAVACQVFLVILVIVWLMLFPSVVDFVHAYGLTSSQCAVPSRILACMAAAILAMPAAWMIAAVTRQSVEGLSHRKLLAWAGTGFVTLALLQPTCLIAISKVLPVMRELLGARVASNNVLTPGLLVMGLLHATINLGVCAGAIVLAVWLSDRKGGRLFWTVLAVLTGIWLAASFGLYIWACGW